MQSNLIMVVASVSNSIVNLCMKKCVKNSCVGTYLFLLVAVVVIVMVAAAVVEQPLNE